LVEVAGSIPDGLIGIFLRLNLSGRTMTLGSTQTLKEIEYQEKLLGCKGGRCLKVTTLPPVVRNAESLDVLKTS